VAVCGAAPRGKARCPGPYPRRDSLARDWVAAGFQGLTAACILTEPLVTTDCAAGGIGGVATFATLCLL
jgi:hypothetical protein